MAGWHHQLDRHEFEQTPGVCDGQGGLACCKSWGLKESDMTEWLNWTEPVVQWLRIFLPMLGTWIQSLVWEDPTCHRATQPVHHSYWSPRAAMEAAPGRSPCTTRKSSPCLPKLETARVQQRRPSVARKKVLTFKSYSILICSDNLDSVETRVLYWPGQTAALRETGQRAKPQSLEPSGLLPTLSPPSTNEKAIWAPCILLAQEWCQSRELDLAGCSWLEPRPLPLSLWTEHITVPICEGANTAYPTCVACYFLPALPAVFHWLPACLVWQLPEHWDLKMSSKCLSPATAFQPIFRITSSSFGFLRNYSSFSASKLFPFPVQAEVSSSGNVKLRGSGSCSQPRRRYCFHQKSFSQRRGKTWY